MKRKRWIAACGLLLLIAAAFLWLFFKTSPVDSLFQIPLDIPMEDFRAQAAQKAGLQFAPDWRSQSWRPKAGDKHPLSILGYPVLAIYSNASLPAAIPASGILKAPKNHSQLTVVLRSDLFAPFTSSKDALDDACEMAAAFTKAYGKPTFAAAHNFQPENTVKNIWMDGILNREVLSQYYERGMLNLFAWYGSFFLSITLYESSNGSISYTAELVNESPSFTEEFFQSVPDPYLEAVLGTGRAPRE